MDSAGPAYNIDVEKNSISNNYCILKVK